MVPLLQVDEILELLWHTALHLAQYFLYFHHASNFQSPSLLIPCPMYLASRLLCKHYWTWRLLDPLPSHSCT